MKKLPLLLIALPFFFGCSKEEVKPAMSIKNDDITLFRESAETLIVENNPGDMLFESQNKLIASVSDEGVVEGGVRGETTVMVTSLGEVAVAKVVVNTIINYIPEPYLGFGENVETVKSKVNYDEDFIEMDDGFAVTRKIDKTDVVYVYGFEDGRLNMSFFMFKTLSNITSVITDFLLERYVPVSLTGAYSAGFISPEKDMAVLLSASDNKDYIYVGYMKYDGEAEAMARALKTLTLHSIPQ